MSEKAVTACAVCGRTEGHERYCVYHFFKSDTSFIQVVPEPGTPEPTVTTTTTYEIKDSGKREEFKGGMVRDTAEGKINYALVNDGPMLKRWAQHLTAGAKKYAKRNWMLAEGQEEYDRAKESAFRHFMQWFNDENDEDHGAAVMFNINEVEYLKLKRSK